MHITADISILNDVYTYFTLICSLLCSALPLGYLRKSYCPSEEAVERKSKQFYDD